MLMKERMSLSEKQLHAWVDRAVSTWRAPTVCPVGKYVGNRPGQWHTWVCVDGHAFCKSPVLNPPLEPYLIRPHSFLEQSLPRKEWS